MSHSSLVLLFDIDGTLVSTGGAGKAALEAAVVEEFGLDGPCAQVPMSGRTDRAIAGDLLRLHGLENSEQNWLRLRSAYLKRLPDSLATRPGRILPGVIELLDRLAGRTHITIGLLTGNMGAGAELKLSHFDLYRHFPFGAFGEVHIDRDDIAREALGLIRQRLSAEHPAERVWVIGDTPFDVRCARAIGAKAVAVATGSHTSAQLAPTKADVLVENLADVAAIHRLWGIE